MLLKDILKSSHKMMMKLTLVVNFPNILRASFAPISFHQKMSNPNCNHIKAAQNTFPLKKQLVKYFTNIFF